MSSKKQNFLQGAMILSAATIVVKVIGALFKIPLTTLSTTAFGYFSTAYNIYVPIYTIAVSGFPVAVSRSISAAVTMGRYKDVRVLYRTAFKIFLITGTIGSLIMLIASFVYPNSIGMPGARPTMLVMFPAIFFCCIVAAHRGLYEGSRNMVPTAISQILESIGKLVVGLSLAYGAMYLGQWQFAHGGIVFGQKAATAEDALSISLPYVAAGAMLGITFGSFLAFVYMIIKHKKTGIGFSREQMQSSPAAISNRKALRNILAIAIPVAIGSVASQLTNLIDSLSLQYCLKGLLKSDLPSIMKQYEVALSAENLPSIELIQSWLVGLFGTAMTYAALVPTITTTFGISALPAVTAAWTGGDKRQLKATMKSAIRLTLLLALPSTIGLSVLATPLMKLFYKPMIAEVVGPLLTVVGVSVVFMCLLYPVNAMMQAVGRADVPVKIIAIGGAVKLILNIILIPRPALNIMGSAISTAVCYLVMCIMSLVMLRKVSGVNLHYLGLFMKPLIASVLCGVAAWASQGLLAHVLPGKIATIGAVIIAAVVYVVVLFAIKALKRSDIEMLPKGQKIAKMLAKRNWIE